jgi:hypothetical protein
VSTKKPASPIATIMEALKLVGYPLPEGTTSVTLDNEEAPTRASFICHVRRSLNDEESKLMAQAVQLHKVGHRLKGTKP